MRGAKASSRLRQFSELWLTPLIGVLGLCAYSLHNHLSLWHSLHSRLVPAILLAVPLLMLAALAMRFLKATPLPPWAALLASAGFSCFLVGAFYFFAADYYYPIFFPSEPVDESRADMVAIWQGEAESAGMITAVAAALSGFIMSRLFTPREGA